MIFVRFIAVIFLFAPTIAVSHGEDEPGPHGGEIRMPGAFHTEVVQLSPNKVKVYLLDLHWKNPTTTNSSLQVKFTGARSAQADCQTEGKAFLCSFHKEIDINEQGSLEIHAVRGDQRGMAVHHPTPLQFKGNTEGQKPTHDHNH